MGLHLRPATLEDALAALAARPFTLLAGGTDHFSARAHAAVAEDVLDLSGLSELRRIAEGEAGWTIPCGATWTDVLRADLPPAFDALRQAARQVGGPQVQNRGTVVGNLCHASPAADGTPCLLALEAEVELASLSGRRRVKVAEFVTGPRRTVRRADEIALALHVPRGVPARSVFGKLGARAHLVISIVSVAVGVTVEGGRAVAARVAVGACSPVPLRLPAAEAAILAGRAITDADLDGLAPIDDVRAEAAYRRAAALELLRRAVAELGA